MIFYDLKSGYHYHITTIISTKINMVDVVAHTQLFLQYAAC